MNQYSEVLDSRYSRSGEVGRGMHVVVEGQLVVLSRSRKGSSN